MDDVSASRPDGGLARSAIAAAKSTWLLGVLVGLCSWSFVPSTPVQTIDSSWMLGLQMALAEGFHFGPETIFTYGPLGFLQAPLTAFSPYAELAAVYTLAVRLALGLTLVWATRRSFGLWLSLLISLTAALLLTLAPIVAITLTWCLVALGPGSPARVRRLFPFVAGPVAAIEMLDKLSIGPLIFAICAITVVAMEGRRLRNAIAFATGFVVSLAAFWFALGQGTSNVGEFLRSGYEIVSGYSSAMAAAAPGDEGARIVAFLAMTLAALLVGYVGTRRLPPIRRLAVALVLGLTSFAVWKMSFVRFGSPTMPYLFTALIPAWLAFPWRQVELPGQLRQASMRGAALAGFAVVALLYFPITQLPLSSLDPSNRVDLELDQLADLLLPSRLDQVRAQARLALAAHFPLDPRTRALLGGHPVSVDQADIAVAWAYDLDWHPLPVFQAYAAYTPYLDRLNRRALLARDGPSRVLRVTSVDPTAALQTNPDEAQSINWLSDAEGGLRAWNQPETTLAMLCNFEPLSTTQAFQVLARAENRCGPARRLSSTSAGYGEEIPVPAPPGRHELVFADIEGLAPAGWERLRTVLYRAPLYRVTLNRASQYTVMPELEDGLILRASPDADFPAPFALAPQATTMRFEREGTPASTSGLQVSFYAMRVGARTRADADG